MSIPAIILVQPQLGENIGKAARVMLNFGLDELRLVAPRDGWPNPAAGPAASGADGVIDRAVVFDDIADAVADLNRVYAATVRGRDMPKPVVTPQEAAAEMRAAIDAGQRVGILFGREKSGLSNEEVVFADTIWTVPVNAAFASLNLAQAVAIAAYEWHRGSGDKPAQWDDSPPAPKAELEGLIGHLEEELEAHNYFRPAERAPTLRRTLRNILEGGGFTAQQVQTLRGVVKALASPSRDRGE